MMRSEARRGAGRARTRFIGRALRRVERPDPAQFGDRLVMPVDAQVHHRPVKHVCDMQTGGVLVGKQVKIEIEAEGVQQ